MDGQSIILERKSVTSQRGKNIRYIFLLTALVVAGCAGTSRNPIPEQIYGQATVLGRDDLRWWGDEAPPVEWAKFTRADRNVAASEYPGISNREHHYLAISGGGANGAYGAGLLVGWSSQGTRPEFALVTGISTGALTAPFAFLGSEYDDELKQVYTTLDTSGILELRNIFSLFATDSVTDVKPLIEMLERYIDEEVIEKIAAEHRSGRRLFVGTTNLDASRPVYWNLGRIADSGHPDAPRLIRDILRASASIPGVFPPVYIRVQGPDGQVYDEMHVDGGLSSQMFLYPPEIEWDEMTRALGVKGAPTAYVIRNAYRDPEFETVEPTLVPIMAKTVASMIRTQGIGDAYRIYTLAKRDGVSVLFTWIPKNAVAIEPEEAFDPAYMSALFEFGYRRLIAGDAWVDAETLVAQQYRVR